MHLHPRSVLPVVDAERCAMIALYVVMICRMIETENRAAVRRLFRAARKDLQPVDIVELHECIHVQLMAA